MKSSTDRLQLQVINKLITAKMHYCMCISGVFVLEHFSAAAEVMFNLNYFISLSVWGGGGLVLVAAPPEGGGYHGGTGTTSLLVRPPRPPRPQGGWGGRGGPNFSGGGAARRRYMSPPSVQSWLRLCRRPPFERSLSQRPP